MVHRIHASAATTVVRVRNERYKMTTYTAIQGDTWDTIAYKNYGSGTEAQAGNIMAANFPLLDFFIFPAGVTVNIPEKEEAASSLPPWKQ